MKNVKVDVNAKRSDGGATALLLLSSDGNGAVALDWLKHNRLDVNAEDDTGHTALILASSFGYEALVHVLLKDQRIDVNVTDVMGRSAFCWASYHDNRAIKWEFLKHDELDVNANGAHGCTALMCACLRGRSSMVLELLNFPTDGVCMLRRIQGLLLLILPAGMNWWRLRSAWWSISNDVFGTILRTDCMHSADGCEDGGELT